MRYGECEPGEVVQMNAGRKGIAAAMAMGVLMLASGCKEIQVMTRVFPNGSCERSIAVEGDSRGVGDIAVWIPDPDDESWNLEVTPNEQDTEGDSLRYTWTKSFRRVSDLDAEIAGPDEEILSIRSNVELTKHRRWFTTYIRFSETYRSFYPFRALPFTENFTPEEIARMRGDEDDPELDERVMEWEIRSLFEELYQSLLEGAESLDDPELNPEILEAGKDSLYAVLIRKAEDSDIESLTPITLEVGEEVYGTGKFALLRPNIEEFDRRFIEYMDFGERVSGESYKHTVIMPGLISDTNASEIKLNSVTWNVEQGEFSHADYELWVESRFTNRFAIWLSAILLAVVVVVLVIIQKRR